MLELLPKNATREFCTRKMEKNYIKILPVACTSSCLSRTPYLGQFAHNYEPENKLYIL